MLAALGILGRKILVDFLSEPEKGIKFFLVSIVLPLLVILLFFALPIIILVSLPVLLLNPGNLSDADLNKQMDTIAIYQNAYIENENSNLEWIEEQKKKYSSHDDIVVENNSNVEWQHLMAIDAVRYEQNFSEIKESEVISLANKFIVRNVKKENYEEEVKYKEEENYTVQEPYQVKEEYREWVTHDVEETYEVWEPYIEWLPFIGRYVEKTRTVTKSEWVTKTKTITKYRTVEKTKTVTKTKMVNRDRVIIEISSRPFENILDSLNFTEIEKEVAFNIYSTTLSLNTTEIGGDYSDGEYVGGILAWPVPGKTRISSPYGPRIHPIFKTRGFHTGIDIPADAGHDFIAPADGKVVFSGYSGGYGKMIMVDIGGGTAVLGAHNSQLLVSKGQQVSKGQVIAKIGSTGNSTGPHSHFEVRVKNKHTSPLPYLR